MWEVEGENKKAIIILIIRNSFCICFFFLLGQLYLELECPDLGTGNINAFAVHKEESTMCKACKGNIQTREQGINMGSCEEQKRVEMTL